MAENFQERKSRGGCLTTYLTIFLILNVLGIIMNLSVSFVKNMEGLPSEVVASLESINITSTYISVAFGLISIIALILIFKWKKFGVYLYLAALLIPTAMKFFTVEQTSSLIYSIIGTVTGLLIFYFAIKNVYKHLT